MKPASRSVLAVVAGSIVALLLSAPVVVIVARWPAPTPLPPGDQDPTTVVTDPVAERPSPPPGAPNVVLVVACTLRRDQTSVHEGGPPTTPTLARWAEEGVRFTDLVAAAPWTRAASTALLTGHHPLSVGMVEPGQGRNERALPERVVTLAEHLRAHGYATLGMTANPNVGSTYGFHQGFDAYREPSALWSEDPVRIDGDDAIPRALGLLELAEPGRPVFLQVVLVDTHGPHGATEAERAALAAPGLPEAVVDYRATVRRLDEALAALERGLAARGLEADDTLLVVVSDHGEGLGWPAHHGRSHGRYLAPSAVGAVWVMRGPGVPARRVVDGVASQVDVGPTVLSLAGVDPLPGAAGRDLAPAVRGARSGTGRAHAFTDTWFKRTDRAAVYTGARACQLDFAPQVTGPRDPGDFRTGCFDRKVDPMHERPFVDEVLLDGLRTWRRERTAEGARFGAAPTVIPSEAVNRQLEALGYVTGDEGASAPGGVGAGDPGHPEAREPR